MSTKKILIVDGNNACWRLIKRLPLLSVDGKPVQVIYGFVRLLHGVLSQFEPDVALVCWDTGHSTFRLKTYSEYKANRDHGWGSPNDREYDSCISQMTALQDDILPMLNVAKIKHEGTEADDLIGLSCTVLDGHKTVISSDKDMLQLVSSDTQVWAPPIPSRPGMLYTRGNFTKLTGLTPRQYLEMRALTGDGSDNISGVAKGFGEITATELLQKYGSVENLFTKEVEKTLVKRGNRYALLYSEGAREKAYRNLLMMDLKICGQHVNDRDKVVRELRSQIHNRTRINKGLVKRVFLEKKFKSLLETFGTWLIPFERLDSEEA